MSTTTVRQLINSLSHYPHDSEVRIAEATDHHTDDDGYHFILHDLNYIGRDGFDMISRGNRLGLVVDKNLRRSDAKRLFTVIWFYRANHGMEVVMAYSKADAMMKVARMYSSDFVEHGQVCAVEGTLEFVLAKEAVNPMVSDCDEIIAVGRKVVMNGVTLTVMRAFAVDTKEPLDLAMESGARVRTATVSDIDSFIPADSIEKETT